jgi:hypothetical protein
MTSTLNLNQFRSAFQTGGLRSISLQASGGQFFVTARPQSGDPVTLTTTQGKKPRSFRNPAKALEVLHRMGAHKVEVDLSAWAPDQVDSEDSKRPDTALRQRRAHQAAAHDNWFREQVHASLLEADSVDVAWESQADVKAQSTKKRAAWLNLPK